MKGTEKKETGIKETGIKEIWRLLKKYRKEQRGNYILFALSAGIFAVIFMLYDISVKVVWYPFLICIILWIFADIGRFYGYQKAHGARMDLANHIEVTLEHLTSPSTLIEEDYQRLLRIMAADHEKRSMEWEEKQKNLKEYFTLWSHQMKTPITSLELLLQQEEPEKSQLKESLFEIENYVDMTLQYIRFDSLNRDLRIENYPLYPIVKQAVKYYSKIFIARGISLNMEEFQESAFTDEKWLLFVIKQILSNALKYTRQGSISIYMENECVLVIKDTGIGILQEDIPRLFERGFTGYNGRMQKKATGLGLYLSKQVLTKLNHGIEVVSEPGEGTAVKISFPPAVF